MTITSTAIDINTRKGIPGATVELYAGNVMLVRQIADVNGKFSISTMSEPDRIVISSSEYSPKTWALPGYAGLYVFELTRKIIELDDVTVTAKRKKVLTYAGLLLLLLLAIKDK